MKMATIPAISTALRSSPEKVLTIKLHGVPAPRADLGLLDGGI